MALDPHPAPSGEARRASAERLEGALDQLADKAKDVAGEDFDAVVDVPNDPNDDPVLETALSGRAEVLCTLDRHFHHRTVLRFCREHGIQVLTDVELLSMLRA